MEDFETIWEKLGNMPKATIPDFFYTRLQGKLKQDTSVTRRAFILRPAIVCIAAAVIVTVNILSWRHSGSTARRNSNEQGLQLIAESYGLSAESLY